MIGRAQFLKDVKEIMRIVWDLICNQGQVIFFLYWCLYMYIYIKEESKISNFYYSPFLLFWKFLLLEANKRTSLLHWLRGDNKRNQAWLINGPVALVSKWKKIMLDWDNRWNHWNLRVDRVKLNDTSSIQFSGPNSITLDFKISSSSSSSSFFRHKSSIFIPIFNLFFFVREQGVYFSLFFFYYSFCTKKKEFTPSL